MSKLNDEYKKAMDIVMGNSMDDLLNIVTNKRDNAMRDYEVKDKENKSPYELCELRGEINAYNDVITYIETVMGIKTTINAFIETFENKNKEN